jgi:multimeric flavodoxin WrbA
MPTSIRKGQAPEPATREVFFERYHARFMDPAFDSERDAIDRLAAIAFDAYTEGRKAPVTRKAGPGFADPDYDLSKEWYDAREALRLAQERWESSESPSRVLIVNGSPRNDGTCPGEISKTWRMSKMVREEVEKAGMQADLLDLSLVTSDYDRHIHPCKGCVSTAMPLCHWPCSCYPNHADGQVNDWMFEIYERWVSAHGVIILAPTHWYQSPSVLKQMIDRLVCADGGNPDPTTTQGKKAKLAKEIEQKGWDFPKHIAGRAYGVVVHGDVAGVEVHRRNLTDWLDWMGLIDAGALSRLDRYLGYYEPYWNSHDALDKDEDLQQETRNVARAVVRAVTLLREGKLSTPDEAVKPPRPK